ncbi:signal peptide peptidase SppA [Schlesneria paludicola]|uniref:signal peptide peptidase SppA n=1 Tax=Schlesneria paludicola TaxID=360056 RepID=UPI00029A8019|nr:signal peptide peptidase SppA [Schlesneria paludicola]
MTETTAFAPGPRGSGGPQTILVQTQVSSPWRGWIIKILMAALVLSILANIGLFSAYRQYFSNVDPPHERFHSGSVTSTEKIAILKMESTIMPPYTERLIRQIDHAAKDKEVKGVLLVVDSPGGLVADSHQIYHRLQKLRNEKPVYVQMKRIAASGGYYIAMGAGPDGMIYAEPTTWTGSIGVILPRYDFSKLADTYGVASDPLKTGKFKDTLNPFRPMTDDERKLWENIIDQSYQKFITVIDDNRKTLNRDAVTALATGQIYTADDAKQNMLIDEIGFEEDSLAALKEKIGVKNPRVVNYETPTSLMDIVLGNSKAQVTGDPWKSFIESTVPRAMYYCSWLPVMP